MNCIFGETEKQKKNRWWVGSFYSRNLFSLFFGGGWWKRERESDEMNMNIFCCSRDFGYQLELFNEIGH